MAIQRLITLPDGDAMTLLVMTAEEFKALRDEIEVMAEIGGMPWEDREALESARRENRLPRLVRGLRTERLFARLGVETNCLAAVVADGDAAPCKCVPLAG